MTAESTTLILGMQYNHKRSMLDIELNENLRRKRNDLERSIEMLTDVPHSEGSDAAHIDAKTRELSTLETSVKRITKELEGNSLD
jgi:structural maintenance of chromosome 3 (chondroitin sulfate proteoglycan 6)